MGEVTQIIPADRVAARRRMQQELLMMSAAQMGLNAQDVAALVAFLGELIHDLFFAVRCASVRRARLRQGYGEHLGASRSVSCAKQLSMALRSRLEERR